MDTGDTETTVKSIHIDKDVLQLVKERPNDPELRLHLLQGCWRCIHALANTAIEDKHIGFEPVAPPEIHLP